MIVIRFRLGIVELSLVIVIGIVAVVIVFVLNVAVATFVVDNVVAAVVVAAVVIDDENDVVLIELKLNYSDFVRHVALAEFYPDNCCSY